MERFGSWWVGGVGVEGEQFGAGFVSGLEEIVVEAGELAASVRDLVGDGGADAAAAYEQAASDHFADSLTDGGSGQVEAVGEVDLFLDGVPRSEGAVVDGGGELGGELLVEGNGAAPVDVNGQFAGHVFQDRWR